MYVQLGVDGHMDVHIRMWTDADGIADMIDIRMNGDEMAYMK